jgi:hypothetical protein
VRVLSKHKNVLVLIIKYVNHEGIFFVTIRKPFSMTQNCECCNGTL